MLIYIIIKSLNYFLINKNFILNLFNMNDNKKTVECIKIIDLIKDICKTPQFKISKNYEFIMEDENKKKSCNILLKNLEVCKLH